MGLGRGDLRGNEAVGVRRNFTWLLIVVLSGDLTSRTGGYRLYVNRAHPYEAKFAKFG